MIGVKSATISVKRIKTLKGSRVHTVIVGGGFAGVKAALELAKKNIGKVTLVSDEPYFLHHATLYATATGRSKSESVIPLESIFKNHSNVMVVQDRMISLDPDRKLVVGKKKSYQYDTLIIAIGVVTTYFGIDGMQQHSFGIKTLEDVQKFNNHLHTELVADKHLDKNYVIIGAGPTGVELAGALKTYLSDIAKAHHIRRAKVNITLVEAAPRILPRSSQTASRKVQRQLEKIGVKVLTNHKVEALSNDYITIDGKKTATETAIWTSGVTNHPFFSEHTDYFHTAPNRRVEVNQYLEAYRDIYVLGDNANTQHTGLAWTALRDAQFIADHLARKVAGKPLKARHSRSPMSGIPVTDTWAYVEWGGMYADGRVGSWMRRLIELRGYRMLLPAHQAKKAWRAHFVREEQCDLCKSLQIQTVVKT